MFRPKKKNNMANGIDYVRKLQKRWLNSVKVFGFSDRNLSINGILVVVKKYYNIKLIIFISNGVQLTKKEKRKHQNHTESVRTRNDFMLFLLTSYF